MRAKLEYKIKVWKSMMKVYQEWIDDKTRTRTDRLINRGHRNELAFKIWEIEKILKEEE